jgi:hypothetical protein
MRMINYVASVAAAVVLIVMTPAVASAGSPVDRRVTACVRAAHGGCVPGIAVDYWYLHGGKARRVAWVYASKVGKSGRARWWYRKPGGRYVAGSPWKAAHRVSGSSPGFVSTSWGNGGHTGEAYPKNTQICVEFWGTSRKACASLK